jgi:uncharacterized protein YhfF
MSRHPPEIQAYWAAFRAATGVPDEDYDAIAFGHGPAMADWMCRDVLAGIKRATCMPVRDHMVKGLQAPVVGGHVVLLDGKGAPRGVWRTTEVRVGPLNSVDEAFAWDEGEGDRSRAVWLDNHLGYFAKQAAREGWEMTPDLPCYFERFTIVWPPESADQG